MGLVGPDIGQEASDVGLRGRVKRVAVAPHAAQDLQGGVERGDVATPLAGDGEGGVVRPPRPAIAKFVAVLVEAEIEPGTGAYLQHGERQAGEARDRERGAQNHARTRHLVGLRWAVEPGGQELIMLPQRLGDRQPQALPLEFDRRVDPAQKHRTTGTRQRVQGAAGAQCQHVGPGIACPVEDPPTEHGTAVEPLCQQPAKARRERRAQLIAGLRLPLEVLDDRNRHFP